MSSFFDAARFQLRLVKSKIAARSGWRNGWICVPVVTQTVLNQQNSSDAPNSEAADVALLRAEVAQLRARLDAFERILQIRDAASGESPLTPSVASIAAPLPQSYDIAADQLLPVQDGFYQLEWGPEGAFRWTGPGDSIHFEAWIDRSAPLIATFRIFHFGTPANAKELTIEVDGTRYALQREGTSKVLHSEPIAARASDGPTRVTLHVPHVHSPSDRGAADKRRLGVAFQRLRIARD